MLDIDNYSNVINKMSLTEMKEAMAKTAMNFNVLCNSKAMNLRENDLYEVYKTQYYADLNTLFALRDNAQKIADLSNIMLFKLTLNTQEHYKDAEQDLPLLKSILS